MGQLREQLGLKGLGSAGLAVPLGTDPSRTSAKASLRSSAVNISLVIVAQVRCFPQAARSWQRAEVLV